MSETRNRLKQLHGRLFEQVTAALFEADPIGINFGFNTDEYDAEAGTIIPRLQSCTSALDVNHVVFEEFLRWFSAESAGELAAYRQVSEVIWHIWQNSNAGKVNG